MQCCKMFKKVRIDDLKSKNDIKIEHVNPGWCWKMDNAPMKFGSCADLQGAAAFLPRLVIF